MKATGGVGGVEPGPGGEGSLDPLRREAGGNTHQAVSSRKMPSRSRCVKSSPPVTQTCQQLCAGTKLLCSPSLGFFSGRVGLVIPALPASQSCRGDSIQFSKRLPTPTRCLALCWVKLGTEVRSPSHCLQDAQSTGETDTHTAAPMCQTEATALRAYQNLHRGDRRTQLTPA